jgi:hypothetical protein
MAQDRIGGIVRALVGVPQERLAVVGKVVNGLNSAAEHGDDFQTELSKFVLGWKPSAVPVAMMGSPDLARWSDNYYKLFNQRPDLSALRIPEKPEGVGPMRLIVGVRELVEWTENRLLEGVQEVLKKHFRGWEYDSDLDAAIPTNDRDPRSGSYAVWVKDVREADKEFANKSADDLKAEGHTGITLLERQLLEADYFFEKGEHLDVENVTLCTGSRDADGGVPGCDGDAHDLFYVYYYYASDRGGDLRSRRVWA